MTAETQRTGRDKKSSTTLTVGKLTVTTAKPREIRAERTLNAPRDRVWRAFTEDELIKQWWGRGNKLVIEKNEVRKGGHWRFVEHTPEGVHGFEGRYREVTPKDRIVRTFEWDGMPGYPCVETATFEDLGDKTRVVSVTQFFTDEERDGMAQSGMADGMEQSYAALEKLLATLT